MKSLGTKTIETERLILRKFVIEDADEMYNNWASDAEVTKYLTWPVHSDIEVTQNILGDWINNYNNDYYFNWAIVFKQTNEVVGNISVVKFNKDILAVEIGYCLSRKLWGNNIMPEALKAIIDYLFNDVGINRIAACHDINNPNSGKVMKKAGMKYEGTLRKHGLNNQGICDEVYYSIIKTEYMIGN